MKGNSKIVLLITLMLFVHTYLSAQYVTSSPYSRYGIGELQNSGYSQNFAMGGLGAAIRNDTLSPYFINCNNPASYPYNRITSFELGAASNTLQTSSSSEKQLTNTTTLSHVAFAFPVYTKWWGMGFGIKPFSGVGYNVTDSKTIDSVGTVNYKYNGAGGINQIYWGNGFRIKNFSFGADASFLLGRLENTSYIILPSTGNYVDTRTYKTTNINSFYFDYGAQYAFHIDSVRDKSAVDSVEFKHVIDSIKYRFSYDEASYKHAVDSVKNNSNKFRRTVYRRLKEPVRIIFGGKLTTAVDLNAKASVLTQTYVPTIFGSFYLKDTIQNTSGTKETIHLPLMYTAGVTFTKGDRILLGAEYEYQAWADYKVNTTNGGLKNSSTYKLGFQILPASKSKANVSYFQKVYYRAGFRYSDSHLDLQNTAITEYAASIGFGFPVGYNRKQWTAHMFNLGLEVGQRGTTDNNLVQEKFFKVLLGITINDRWFVKPKFD